MRTLDELLATPAFGGPSGATPGGFVGGQTFQIPSTPTPADLSAAAAAGLANVRSTYGNPYTTPGMSGMPTPGQMTPANFGYFRNALTPPPPALMSTPGVTGMFHGAGSMGAQAELGLTAKYLDPATAASNFASGRLEAWGQKYGTTLGEIAGTAGGMAVGGGGLMGWGATIGGGVGSYLGGKVQHMPGANWMHQQLYGGAAQQLMMMSNLQHRTMGRLFLNEDESGLGGRGMNMRSAMTLGRRLEGMAQGSGGEFNRMDMLNITQSAGDMGLLDSAENIEQIGNTVGKLMKVVGKMAKLTGDPDFRNNLRELSNLRQSGYTIDEAVTAVSSMGSYARMAGMTRGQVMEAGGSRGAALYANMGLAPGVGMMAGAYGAAHGRAMQGVFSPMEQALMGDTGQRITENQAAFAGSTLRLMIPSALGVDDNGKITIDQNKLRALSSPGGLDNLSATMGSGQNNMYAAAQKISQQTGRQFQDVMAEIMGRMPELQSTAAKDLGPGGMQRMQMNTMAGMINAMGPGSSYLAALKASGGDVHNANILMAQVSDPKYMDRLRAMYRQEVKDANQTALEEGRNARAARDEAMEASRIDYGVYNVRRGGRESKDVAIRSAWRSVSDSWELDDRTDQLREADREAANLYREQLASQGLKGVYGGQLDAKRLNRTMERMKEMRGGGMRGANFETGMGMENARFTEDGIEFSGDESAVSEGEMESAITSLGLGTIDAWRVRTSFDLEANPQGKDAVVYRGAMRVAGDKAMSPFMTGGKHASLKQLVNSEVQRSRKAAKINVSARKMSFADVMTQRKGLIAALKGKGLHDAPGATASIMSRVKQEATAIGRDGGSLSAPDIKRVALKVLSAPGSGFTAAEAREFLDNNEDALTQHVFADIKNTGTPEARAAVATGDTAAWMASQADIGGVEQLVVNEQTTRDAMLTSMGLGDSETTSSYWGFGETTLEYQIDEGVQSALNAFDTLTPEEQAYAVRMSASGEDAEMLKMELSGTEGGKKSLQKIMGALKGRGRDIVKGASTLMTKAGISGQEALMKEFQASKMGGGESGFSTFGGTRLHMAQATGKKMGTTALDVREGAAPATDTEAGKAAERAGKELAEFEKMREMFIGKNGVAPELRTAAVDLQNAAAALSNSTGAGTHTPASSAKNDPNPW